MNLFFSGTLTAAPQWWYSRNVIETNAVTMDYAPVVLGQLKWFAAKAMDELDEHLTNGAGTNVQTLVAGFLNSNNWNTVNVGQLKNVAQPYWDRLITEGYTNAYPWTVTTNDDTDLALANIGQMKYVFDFGDRDGDGLWDGVETGTGVYLGPNNTGTNPNLFDTDGDGIGDGAEVANRTDPNNSDATKPSVTITYPPNNKQVVWVH